jgi:hypothetical protein
LVDVTATIGRRRVVQEFAADKSHLRVIEIQATSIDLVGHIFAKRTKESKKKTCGIDVK